MQQFPSLCLYQQKCEYTFIHNSQALGGKKQTTGLEIKIMLTWGVVKLKCSFQNELLRYIVSNSFSLYLLFFIKTTLKLEYMGNTRKSMADSC